MLVAEERRGAVARLRGPMGGSMGPTELVHGDRDVSFLIPPSLPFVEYFFCCQSLARA